MMGIAIVSVRRRLGTSVAKILAVAAVSFVTLQAAPASATLLAYDPFLIGDTPADGEYIESTYEGNPVVLVNPLLGQNPTIGPTAFFSGPWTVGIAAAKVHKPSWRPACRISIRPR